MRWIEFLSRKLQETKSFGRPRHRVEHNTEKDLQHKGCEDTKLRMACRRLWQWWQRVGFSLLTCINCPHLSQCFMPQGTTVCAHLPVSCDHLVTQNGPQDCLHLEAGLHQAPGCSNHTGCQGPADSNSAQVLKDVGCQSEWYRAVGIQVTCIAHIGKHVTFILTIRTKETIPIPNHLLDLNTIMEVDILDIHSKKEIQVTKCTHTVTILAMFIPYTTSVLGIKCVFHIFSVTSAWNIFPFNKYLVSYTQDAERNACGSSCEVSVCSPIIIKIGMCEQILAEFPTVKFYENPFSGVVW
jgi:hypothetical protein